MRSIFNNGKVSDATEVERCQMSDNELLRYRDPVVDRGNVTSTTVIRVVFTTSYFQTVKDTAQ